MEKWSAVNMAERVIKGSLKVLTAYTANLGNTTALLETKRNLPLIKNANLIISRREEE